MKVLWFSNTPANAAEFLKEGPFGGGWLRSLDLTLQQKADLHVAFYYPRSNESFRYLNTTYHPIQRKNWKLAALSGIFKTILIDKQDLKLYLEIINRVGPDIIHIHGTENPYASIICSINIPVVVSIQGYITVSHHKFLDGFTKGILRTSCLFKSNSLKEFLLHKSFVRILREFKKMKIREQKNLRNTRFIIGRTAWDRRVTSLLAPQGVYFHCDEALRPAFHVRTWQYREDKKLIIHTTNGNNPFKGFETLCEALFEISRLPDINVECQVAGINPDDDIVKVTRKKLKGRFPEAGLRFMGNLDEVQLAEMLCLAHMFVLSSHIENSSNSLCEAMLLGMPCIATFAGGTVSMLKDGEEGILVQNGDPWALAGAILELYRNPDLAKQYGQKARERALSRHNPDIIVNKLLDIYNEIITK